MIVGASNLRFLCRKPTASPMTAYFGHRPIAAKLECRNRRLDGDGLKQDELIKTPTRVPLGWRQVPPPRNRRFRVHAQTSFPNIGTSASEPVIPLPLRLLLVEGEVSVQ